MTDKILIDRSLLQQALDALVSETSPEWECNSYHPKVYPAMTAIREALAAPQRQPVQQCWKCGDAGPAAKATCTVPWCGMRETSDAPPSNCWCSTCRPQTWDDARMVLCPTCGNKRCPKANDHRNACTGSNEPGRPGSSYPALTAPQPAPASPAEIDIFKTPESGGIEAVQPVEPLTKEDIRSLFVASGFKIKEGQTDLMPYVYEAAHALLNASPHREPLTDEQIDVITKAQWGDMWGHPLAAHRAYARAIESAHSIGGKT